MPVGAAPTIARTSRSSSPGAPNEPPGVGRVGDAFVDSLREQATGLNIGTYGVNYAASKLQLHGGDGANDAIYRVKKTSADVPEHQDRAGRLLAGRVGDGHRRRRSDRRHQLGQFPAARIRQRHRGGRHLRRCRRPRRRFAADARAPCFGSKAIDFCNPGDPICHAGAGQRVERAHRGLRAQSTPLRPRLSLRPNCMTLGRPHMPGQLPVPAGPRGSPAGPGSVPQAPVFATGCGRPIAQVRRPRTAVPAPMTQVH